MAPTVTVKELRTEARKRLLKCGSNKTISRMNKSELVRFMSCIHHPDSDRYESVVATQRQPSLARMFAEPRAPAVKRRRGRPMPSNYSPVYEEPDDLDGVVVAKQRRRPKSRPTRRKRVPVPVDSDEEDEDLAGSGGTYRDFVREMLPKMRAQGMTSQESMRAVGAAWRKQRHGGGLMPAGQHGSGHCGQRGGGLVQDGSGFASDLSKWSGRAASGLALSGALGPEIAAFSEPAAGVAKGVSYISGLFS